MESKRLATGLCVIRAMEFGRVATLSAERGWIGSPLTPPSATTHRPGPGRFTHTDTTNNRKEWRAMKGMLAVTIIVQNKTTVNRSPKNHRTDDQFCFAGPVDKVLLEHPLVLFGLLAGQDSSYPDQLQLQHSYPSSSEPSTSTACIGDCVKVSESITLKSIGTVPEQARKKYIPECFKQSKVCTGLFRLSDNQKISQSQSVPDKTKSGLHWFVLSQKKPDQTTDQDCSRPILVRTGSFCAKEIQTKPQIKSVPDQFWFALVRSVPKKSRPNYRSRVFPTKGRPDWARREPNRLSLWSPAVAKGEKNNGFDVLYHNMKYGLIASKELAEFLRERSNIEENTSKLLIKLAKQTGGVCLQGTFAPVWGMLRSSAEKLSNIHLQMVHKVTELVKEVSKYADELHKKHKMAQFRSLLRRRIQLVSGPSGPPYRFTLYNWVNISPYLVLIPVDGVVGKKPVNFYWHSSLATHRVAQCSRVLGRGRGGGRKVNKSLLVENIHEKTVTAQRHIHDEIAGGIKNIHISKKMLDYVRGAQKLYREYLEMNKQERSEEDKKKADKRKLGVQVKDLEGKRKKLMMATEEKREAIEVELQELKKKQASFY
uniref:FCH domain-containing protein n=1 Tax=Timema douglasi TaxID=61478 RepID=A0A7R8VP83_TIMDO|nr:unnamed protein product [Timema douglasi]